MAEFWTSPIFFVSYFKILPNNEDLYVAHDTWNSYQSMLRILKKYDFAYHWTAGRNGRHKIGKAIS